MDAGSSIGPEGVASLVPALERMPRVTSLNLAGARIGLGRAWSVGGFWLFGLLLGCALGWGFAVGNLRLRVGRLADGGVRGVCARGP